MPIYREYYNENAHRYYPFVNANNVPTGLILDLCLIATPNLPTNATSESTDVTYISQLTTDGTQLRVYLAATIDADVVDFGCIATTDISTPLVTGGVVGRRTDICYAADGIVFQGYIITGDLERLLPQMPASITLDETTGRLYTNCILPMTKWVSGIQVGNTVLTGLVTVEPGDGVTLTPDTDTNSIRISCIGAALPLENGVIVDDNTLLNRITDLYGIPITSINGVPIAGNDPTIVNGNLSGGGVWTIAVADDEGLAVTADNNTHTITISNPAGAAACCTDDQISMLASNIASLNDRVMTVQSFLTQLETGMNIISTELTRFK